MDSNTNQLLRDWKRRCRESQRNHYIAANRYLRRNRFIGIPAIVLSAVLGTGVLASTQANVGNLWKIAVGLLGVAAAVLTALQVNLNHAERAEHHKSAGARYAAVRREIEQTLALPPGSPEELAKVLDRVRDRMDSLAEQSPALPPDLWDKSQDAIAEVDSHKAASAGAGTPSRIEQ